MVRGAIVAAAILFVLGGTATTPLRAQLSPETDSDASMIGRMAPPWNARAWVNAGSLNIKQFRGKVVLLRFLNDSAASAATLNELYRRYRGRGMAVVGVYNPIPFPAGVKPDHVRELAATHGFQFPIAIDSRWEILNRYWPQGADAELTASTFLIDRKGIIRYIQLDGQYNKNSASRAARKEYSRLEKEIESLLKAKSKAD